MTFFQRQQSSDLNLQKTQSTLERTMKDMPSKEDLVNIDTDIVRGKLIKNLTISSQTPTLVSHRLGRKWKGWIVVNLRQTTTWLGAVAAVQHDTSVSPDPSKIIALTLMGPVIPAPVISAKVSLWVF